ncbi:hypothetical protein K432DRAFT_409755 [Lepidopterella palustris CBS 459.81]|uniref:Uncharacterized protein n=1 Tax=Lepidopterella palustris CBS 459.81 TaxID=1314670 RepID=A0A8E2DZQ7_9PEZI|nr:hypothetical protein K432DRAFT_409755 [Lepidopterella palustris CBS 459.81]
MNQQQARRRPVTLNYQWNPNNLQQEIAHAHEFIAETCGQLHRATRTLESFSRAFNPVAAYLETTKENYEQCYAAYANEYRTHQQTRNLHQDTRNALVREQEGHQYTRTELGLLKQELDKERKVKEDLEQKNAALCENLSESERINNGFHDLTAAMEEQKQILENENQAMKAMISRLQKEPGMADTDIMDGIIDWKEAQAAERALQAKVETLELENEDLKKQLQEAADSIVASEIQMQELQRQLSSGPVKRRRRGGN